MKNLDTNIDFFQLLLPEDAGSNKTRLSIHLDSTKYPFCRTILSVLKNLICIIVQAIPIRDNDGGLQGKVQSRVARLVRPLIELEVCQ